MALRLITAPAKGVISLDEAKGHLSVLHNDDDTLIEGLVQAATSMIDGSPGELNRALISQVWEYSPDEGFPANGKRAICLPLAPVISVEEIRYLDVRGDDQAFAADYWTAIVGERPGVALSASAAWPIAMATPGAVRIKFKAGYGDDAKSVPAQLKVAIKILVGDLYANGGQAGISPVVDRLISPYRHWPA